MWARSKQARHDRLVRRHEYIFVILYFDVFSVYIYIASTPTIIAPGKIISSHVPKELNRDPSRFEAPENEPAKYITVVGFLHDSSPSSPPLLVV